MWFPVSVFRHSRALNRSAPRMEALSTVAAARVPPPLSQAVPGPIPRRLLELTGNGDLAIAPPAPAEMCAAMALPSFGPTNTTIASACNRPV